MAYFDTVKAVRQLAFLLLCLTFGACGAVTYQFDPIEAWVVDAETGKPIEGVVVTANWELVKGSLDGPRYYGQLEVKETVTDSNGRFFFEGFSKQDTSWAELRESDPQVLIFKAGYEFQRFTNNYIDGGANLKKLRRTAAVNGKTVTLRKSKVAKGDVDLAHSQLVSGRLGFVRQEMPGSRETDKCYWQRIPKMIMETRREEQFMRTLGIDPPSLYDHLIKNSDTLASNATVSCQSPRTLFLNSDRP